MHSLILPSDLCMWPLKTLKPISWLWSHCTDRPEAMDGPIKTTTKLHLHVVKEVQILLFEFPYLQSYNSITLLQNLKDQILTTNVWIEHVSFEIILIIRQIHFSCLSMVLILSTLYIRRHSPTLKMVYFKKPKNQATHLVHNP